MYPIIKHIAVSFITLNGLELRWMFEYIHFALTQLVAIMVP